jgi:hypothetical protein
MSKKKKIKKKGKQQAFQDPEATKLTTPILHIVL